ncbi:MAG: SIR2 family protein [Methanotrichaceae archaeon]|nr:SIR2 family protein [Methanotrichaceae archaeon]
MTRSDPRFFGNSVYILGAGFSAYAGMPVMSNFMTRMRDVRELSSDLSPEAAKAIDLVLEERAHLSGVRDKIKLNLDNVEDLFSLIDAKATGERGDTARRLTTSVRKAISATLLHSMQPIEKIRMHIESSADERFIREMVNINPSEGRNEAGGWLESDPYKLFSTLLLQRLDAVSDIRAGTDTVITFNYDLVLENALKWRGVRPDYCLDAKDYTDATRPTIAAPRVIKVHGSVNWDDRGRLGTTVVDEPNELIALPNGRPMLIPPTWAKGSQTRLSRMLWYNSVEAIQKAHRIVIIGYSMPQTDLYFKYLLAAGLQNNVSLRRFSVIDPSDMDENLGEVLDDTYFGSRLRLRQTSFEAFMSNPTLITESLGRGRALIERLPRHES